MVQMTHYSDEDMIPLGETSDNDSSEDLDLDEISERFDNPVEEDSDSDSAPESFSFAIAQEKRKQAEKITSESLKEQRARLKKRRKDILLQNMKQREEKRKKIESKRLPDHVLEELDDEFTEDVPENKLNDHEEPLKKDTVVKEDILQTVGNITFKCKILPVEAKKPKYIPERVAHFKDKMLYNKRIRREKSNRHAILKKEKQCTKR